MRKFGLGAGAYVAVFVGAPFTTAVMWIAAFVVPHEGSEPLLYGTCAVGAAVSWYGTIRFVRECPQRFEVSDARLTAIWFGGRTGSWELQELLVPSASKLLLKDISVTDVSVVDRNGRRAFKISSEIQKWRELVALISPPPPVQAPVQSEERPSVWSRNLL
jgi:hypothetical protein